MSPQNSSYTHSLFPLILDKPKRKQRRDPGSRGRGHARIPGQNWVAGFRRDERGGGQSPQTRVHQPLESGPATDGIGGGEAHGALGG